MVPILLILLVQTEPLVIPGEFLTYEVSSSTFGKIGQARFSVSELENGSLRLAFEFDARVFLFKASDRTVSELDRRTLRTLRYAKRERSPIGRRNESIVVDHAASSWTDAEGTTHELASDDALDELSFIYLIRNLDLAPGEERVLERHFDSARNPVTVRSVAGSSAVLDVIEMSVPDPRQKSGNSVLRFHLSRDQQRVPLRIESSMPLAGRVTMTLIDPT